MDIFQQLMRDSDERATRNAYEAGAFKAYAEMAIETAEQAIKMIEVTPSNWYKVERMRENLKQFREDLEKVPARAEKILQKT